LESQDCNRTPAVWPPSWDADKGFVFAECKRAVDIPNTIKVKSLKKSNAFKCCVLYRYVFLVLLLAGEFDGALRQISYRARCPSQPVGDWPQIPFFLNTRVFSDIPDLQPYGFSDIVRSIVCPIPDVCNGVELDEEFSPEEGYRVTGYWLDVRDLEGHHNLVE